MRHVVFALEKDRYALPLASVREVVLPPPSFSRVPKAPLAIRGIMNLRGRVVTVVEARELLGMGKSQLPCAKVVLLDRDRRDLGLLVTEVEGIESVEKVSPAPGRAVPMIRGVARLRGQVVTLLDPDGVDGAVASLFQQK